MRNIPSHDTDNLSKLILPKELHLIQNISQEDFEYIQGIIKITDLSGYLLDSKDFFVIKNTEGTIVSFGRLYPIEEYAQEIASVRVDENYRGQKIGLYLCQELISHKKGYKELFLATKPSLGKYYKILGFQIISENIPEKLIHTGIRAKENSIEFIIMKHAN